MSKRRFTQEQINELLQNPNIQACSEKSISYSKDFKISAIKQKQEEGLPAQEIFKIARFNIDLVGRETPRFCVQRWLRVFRQKGIEKLSTETRGNHGGGRPKTNWQNEKEKIKYLEAQIAYLKTENDFLAKLRKKS